MLLQQEPAGASRPPFVVKRGGFVAMKGAQPGVAVLLQQEPAGAGAQMAGFPAGPGRRNRETRCYMGHGRGGGPGRPQAGA